MFFETFIALCTAGAAIGAGAVAILRLTDRRCDSTRENALEGALAVAGLLAAVSISAGICVASLPYALEVHLTMLREWPLLLLIGGGYAMAVAYSGKGRIAAFLALAGAAVLGMLVVRWGTVIGTPPTMPPEQAIRATFEDLPRNVLAPILAGAAGGAFVSMIRGRSRAQRPATTFA